MPKEKVIMRVKKVLNLANNNTSEEEAQSAMLRAQELMAKHGLEMRDLGLEDDSEVVDVYITKSMKLHWWYKSLFAVIARNFRCEPYMDGGRLALIGTMEDVDIAREVYFYAESYIRFKSTEFVNEYSKTIGRKPTNSNQLRNDFITGFIRGLSDKFREQIEKNQWGLMVIQNPKVQEEVSKRNFRTAQASRVSRSGDPFAYDSGYKEGKSFNKPIAKVEA